MRKATMAWCMTAALANGAIEAGPPKPLPKDVGAGHIAWFDITTKDLAQAKAFYSGLFGWRFQAVTGSDQAVEIVNGERSIGTMRVAEGTISPYNGIVYVQLTDLLAACRRAAELGGKVEPGFPFNLPEGNGAIAVLTDPSGHPLGLYSRTNLPQAPSSSK